MPKAEHRIGVATSDTSHPSRKAEGWGQGKARMVSMSWPWRSINNNGAETCFKRKPAARCLKWLGNSAMELLCIVKSAVQKSSTWWIIQCGEWCHCLLSLVPERPLKVVTLLPVGDVGWLWGTRWFDQAPVHGGPCNPPCPAHGNAPLNQVA